VSPLIASDSFFRHSDNIYHFSFFSRAISGFAIGKKRIFYAFMLDLFYGLKYIAEVYFFIKLRKKELNDGSADLSL
jgi:hypothetical protein